MNEIARSVITIDPDFAAIWGDLDNAAYEGLKAEIISDGIRDPLVIWNPDNNHILVDGHNRLRVAKELNMMAVPVSYKVFKDKADAAKWIFSHQNDRRNATDGQKVLAMEAIRKCIAEDARKTSNKNLMQFREDSPEWENSPTRNKEETRTRTKVAQEVGLTDWKARQGEYVLKHATEEQREDLRTGKKDLKEVFKETFSANKPTKADRLKQAEQLVEATKPEEGKITNLGQMKDHKKAERMLLEEQASVAYDIIYTIIRESRKLTDEMIDVYKQVYSEKDENHFINARAVWDAGQKLIKLGEWTQEVTE